MCKLFGERKKRMSRGHGFGHVTASVTVRV